MKDNNGGGNGETPSGDVTASGVADDTAPQNDAEGATDQDAMAQGEARKAEQKKKERPYVNPERVKTGGAQRVSTTP